MRAIKNLNQKIFLGLFFCFCFCGDVYLQNRIAEKDTFPFHSMVYSFSNLQNNFLRFEFQNDAIHLNKPTVKPAFFCNLEKKWSANSKWGIRMRLGSLDYVNGLEKKK